MGRGRTIQLRPQRAAAGRLDVWTWFLVPFVLLLIPFLNFAKSNSYPVFSPEILLAAGALLLAGLVLGALGMLDRVIRTFVVAGALTLLIDVQTELFEVYSLHQYMWLPLGIWLVVLFLPRPLETLFLVLVYAMLLVVLLTPGTPPMESNEQNLRSRVQPQATNRKEYWIHIIADEHIGIESIPSEFDPNHRLANRIRDDYVDDGFTVYGRAFTRFSQTHLSLPNILNFSERHPVSLLAKDAAEFSLTDSSYLARLREQGFDVHVFDSTYFRICDTSGEAETIGCSRYNGNSIWGLHGASWPAHTKSMVILRVYARLSKIYTKAILRLDLDGRLSLPQSIAPLLGLKIAALFEDRVLQAEPGSAWLLHVFLPHDPYALDESCTIRDLPWEDNGGHTENYAMNTEQERALMYPLYLAQVECTHRFLQGFFDSLRQAGMYDDAHIVIHGDHGSRIATVNLSARPSYAPDFVPSASTLLDYHGTLFAYKPAGQLSGQYRREVLPVGVLLDKASSGGLSAGVPTEDAPHVYLTEWADTCGSAADVGASGCRLVPVPLPEFSHAGPGDEMPADEAATTGQATSQ